MVLKAAALCASVYVETASTVAARRLCQASSRAMARPLSAPDDLRASAWVPREQGAGTRSHLSEVLAEAGLITAVPELAGDARVMTDRLVRLDWPLPRRPFTLLRHRARRQSHAARAFLAIDTAVMAYSA